MGSSFACWPCGTPNASVLCEIGLHDGPRVFSGHALVLFPPFRMAPALQSQPSALPSTPGAWARWFYHVICHHSVERTERCGVGPGSPASVSQRWLRRSVVPVIDWSWRHPCGAFPPPPPFHPLRLPCSAPIPSPIPRFLSVKPELARWWGLAQGAVARVASHNRDFFQMLCHKDVGDLTHCVSFDQAFLD